mgnify:FL=1
MKKVLELGGKLLITADHGNAEHMRNEDGSPNTAHTTNLVDLIYVADDKDQVTLSDGILADGNGACREPVDDEQGPAFFEEGEACSEAYGRKEGQHKGILIVGIKLEGKGFRLMANKGDEHKEETADNRSRDAVAPEGRALVLDPVSDEEHDGRKGCRADRIGFDEERT